MNIEKCRTCKNFEPFFHSCNLYEREVYLGEGDIDLQPVSIKRIEEDECKYRFKGVNK